MLSSTAYRIWVRNVGLNTIHHEHTDNILHRSIMWVVLSIRVLFCAGGDGGGGGGGGRPFWKVPYYT